MCIGALLLMQLALNKTRYFVGFQLFTLVFVLDGAIGALDDGPSLYDRNQAALRKERRERYWHYYCEQRGCPAIPQRHRVQLWKAKQSEGDCEECSQPNPIFTE